MQITGFDRLDGSYLRRRFVSALWALPMLLLVGLILGASPVQSQSIIDYGALLNPQSDPPATAPAQSSPPAAPLQSRPGVAPSVPTVDDYAALHAAGPEVMFDATYQGVSLFRTRLNSIVSRLPGALEDMRLALEASSPTGRPGYFLGIALFAGLLVVLGRSITSLYAVFIARPLFYGMQRPDPEGFVEKLPVLGFRVLLTTVGIIITMAVATAVGLIFYQDHEATLITVFVVFASWGLIVQLDTLLRMGLAPYMAEYRLPTIGDRDALSLYRWMSGISAFSIATIAFTIWMRALGLATEVHLILTILFSAVALLLMLAMLGLNRRAINLIIYGGRDRAKASWLTRGIATLWLPAVIAYLLLTWGDMTFRLVMGIADGPERMIVPFVVLSAGVAIYAVTSYIIERVFRRARQIAEVNARIEERRAAEEDAALRAQITGDAPRADGMDTSGDGDEDAGGGPRAEAEVMVQQPTVGMQTMEDLARRAASLFAIGAVAYGLIRFWAGPDVFEQNPALNLFEDLLDTVFIGYIAFHAVRIWIDEKIREEGGGSDGPVTPLEGEGGGAGATRLATILPLFRNFLLIVIVTTVLLIIAMEMGVNVAPLFAGAGIVGLALGFGSQALVRDILSGAFFLFDDAFRKGEYIDIGDVKGTVEKISLRSFQLRHHLGMLHTIPFGEIKYLTNFSRDWVMMKLPLRLTYDTDVEKVRKLIKKLGQQLAEHPEHGKNFLQPLKSQGVIMMEDSAMIVRVKFMTYPGEQWVLRKVVFAEIRELFEREGIKFAHREVTVRIPDLPTERPPTEAEIRAIGAAARNVGDTVDAERKLTGTGGMVDDR